MNLKCIGVFLFAVAGRVLSNAPENVVILGSGPAGLTAALYAGRSDLHPLVVEGEQAGGQLTITSTIENYPGFAEPVGGAELIAQTRKQAEHFGARFSAQSVTDVDLSTRPFALTLSSGEKVFTQAVIIATGATAKWMGLKNETRLLGKGVSSCATCDGFFFKNRDIIVVGGGDTALEEALFLARLAKSVTIVHRKDKFKASKIMQDRVFRNSKITILWGAEIVDVLGYNAVEGIRLRILKTHEERDMPVEGVFVAIGHEPNSALFKGSLFTDASGYLKTEQGSTRTNVPGVFAAGDVTDPVYRQAVTAAGSGCMAAIDAQRFLESDGL